MSPAVKTISSPAQTVKEGVEFENNVATGSGFTTAVEEIVDVSDVVPLPSRKSMVMTSPFEIPTPEKVILSFPPCCTIAPFNLKVYDSVPPELACVIPSPYARLIV